jgi:hypothetical protein
MNTTIENSAPPAPVSTAAPAPAAAPMPMAAPAPAPAAPAMAEGGETTSGVGGLKGWFADINIVEVSVSALIVGVGIYAIQYFRLMMAMEKTAYNDVIERIGKLESAQLAAKKTAEVNASGSRSRRPVMRLG